MDTAHITSDEAGGIVLRHASDTSLEDIVAKRAEAPHHGGRLDIWRKTKCMTSLCFPIVGYVPAKGSSIAALRLSRRDGNQAVYVGKAGTDFSAKSAGARV